MDPEPSPGENPVPPAAAAKAPERRRPRIVHDLGNPHPLTRGQKIWIGVGLVGLIGAVLAVVIPGIVGHTCVITYEHNLRGQLWYVQHAEYLYISEVRRPTDDPLSYAPKFWHKDVAGLHGFKSMSRDEPSLDAGMALADDRPVTDWTSLGPRQPYSGYWLRQIRPAKENDPDGDHFAICLFPDQYGKGAQMTFLVSDEGIYEKDLGSVRGIEACPADPLREGWQSTSR